MEKQLSSAFNQQAVANDEHSDLANERDLLQTEPSVAANIKENRSWVDDVTYSPDLDELSEKLVMAFNHCPYIRHSGMKFYYEQGEMIGRVEANENLIGNVAFNILHGGVAATILDSIGGLVGMHEIYRRNQGTFAEQVKKVGRLATVDLRIDYLAPGRGKIFIATAEVIRMGRKGHTARMLLVNDTGTPIAVGIASYAF